MLLDDPAAEPALGWPGYASALAEVVRHSSPRFAIGIFGDWGSGKTTLMRAIWSALETESGVVPVWFNAWRYEREQHLIVPMLDTLREGLVEWAQRQSAGSERTRAERTAEVIGRTARALLAGLTLHARVPLGVVEFDAALDPSKVMAAFKPEEARDDSSSFYHASFSAMRDAVRDFVDAGDRRVVVFIDDLDRCLPSSALEVLESMKLFFDLEGFVFVVGLDQQVIERSVETKYETARQQPQNGAGQVASGTRDSVVDGAAYIKKIFQVSFGLPRIGTDQLDEFFDKLLETGGLPDPQRDNFAWSVRKHLPYLAGDVPVNPREVKRLLNHYTIQLKMLDARGDVGPIDPDIVLALQTIGFRRDWQDVYERLTTEPEIVLDEIRTADQVVGEGQASFRIPRELLDYLADAAPGFTATQLEPYIRSARAIGEADIGLLEVQTAVARMLRQLDDLDSSDKAMALQTDFRGGLSRVTSELQQRSTRATARGALTLAEQLEASLRTLDQTMSDEDREVWVEQARSHLTAIEDAIRIVRRQTTVRAAS